MAVAATDSHPGMELVVSLPAHAITYQPAAVVRVEHLKDSRFISRGLQN